MHSPSCWTVCKVCFHMMYKMCYWSLIHGNSFKHKFESSSLFHLDNFTMFRMDLEQSLAENMYFPPQTGWRATLLGFYFSFSQFSQKNLSLVSLQAFQFCRHRVNFSWSRTAWSGVPRNGSHMKIFNYRSMPATHWPNSPKGRLMVHPLDLLEWGRSPAWFSISPFLIDTAISKNLVKKKIQGSGNVVVKYIAVFLSIFMFESIWI